MHEYVSLVKNILHFADIVRIQSGKMKCKGNSAIHGKRHWDIGQ